MISYGDAVNRFKKSSSPSKVVPLLSEKNLVNALLAWQSVVVSYKQSGIMYDESGNENRLWESLWENASFDIQKFGIVAGLKTQDSQYFFQRLKGLKLIYPDGSIDLFASQYLNAIIIKELGIKQPKSNNGA